MILIIPFFFSPFFHRQPPLPFTVRCGRMGAQVRARYLEVCTIMALLSGALLGALTRRPAWVGFRQEKETQRRKLAELGKKAKAAEAKGKSKTTTEKKKAT